MLFTWTLSIYWLIYLLHVKPFYEKRQMNIECFNEVCFLLTCYLLHVFTDYVGKRDTHYILGWCFYTIVIIAIIVNYSLHIQELISLKIKEYKVK